MSNKIGDCTEGKIILRGKSDLNRKFRNTEHVELKRPHTQEVRIVALMTIQEICVLFEDLPMWLFALTNLNCDNIYLPDVDSFAHLLDIVRKVEVDQTNSKS